MNQQIINCVIDCLAYPTIVLNPDGTVLAANEAAAVFLSHSLVGISIWQLQWWSDSTRLESKWRTACRSVMDGNRLKFSEHLIINTQKVNAEFLLSPMANEHGKISQVFIEITLPHDGANGTYAHSLEVESIQEQATRLDSDAIGFINADPPELNAVERDNVKLPPNAAPQSHASEEKKQEDALIESERKFRLMVDSIEDYAMFMVDTEGFITSWNRGAERLTGYSDIEAIGRHFSMLYPQQSLNKEHAAQELALAQVQGRYEEEGLRMRKNGTHYHAQIIVWRVEDSEGRTIGYAKITRDITARKNAESELKASEAKFRTMTDAIPQIVWSALPDGRNDYNNQRWYDFSGVDQKTITSEGWFDHIHPTEKAEVCKTWFSCVKNTDDFEAQFRLRNASGNYRWTLGRALPVLSDGKVTQWMGTLTDIQDQKRAEATLHESARRKDEYLAMLAHELRNPLAPVRNSTTLLRKITNNHPELIKPVEVIDRQVAHMTRLIDDLLDMARISRGKIELKMETFELGELLKQTVNDFEAEFNLKAIGLELKLPNYLMWIYADRIRIAQAVANLLHNALKFTEPQGTVTVSLTDEIQADKPFAMIKVNDTGIGIDPGLLEHLFQPFVQGHQDLARTKGGLGLGLALIRGFANLHGGHVYATSKGVGHGAEFVFTVPLSSAPPKYSQSSTIPVVTKPLNIVLIDDNTDMVQTLADLLSIDGHHVTYAYDGESGLQLIRSLTPDLVFCDIGLPGALDGYDVARSVRADKLIGNTFIIALSGYGQERDRQLAAEAGFNQHLLKPVDFTMLTAIIRQTDNSQQA